MKSYNHLMEKYLSEDNYYLGVNNAGHRKSKNKNKNSKMIRLKSNVEELKNYFLDFARNFQNDEHAPKEIYDGIRRKD